MDYYVICSGYRRFCHKTDIHSNPKAYHLYTVRLPNWICLYAHSEGALPLLCAFCFICGRGESDGPVMS